jgi:hypothetical protein
MEQLDQPASDGWQGRLRRWSCGPGFFAFSPLLETEVLKEAERDHGHERVAVQAGPSAARRPADPSLEG